MANAEIYKKIKSEIAELEALIWIIDENDPDDKFTEECRKEMATHLYHVNRWLEVWASKRVN